MYDLIPPTACFCGCGRSMSFGRAQVLNGAAMCLRSDVEAFEAATARGAGDEAIARLIAEAAPLLEALRTALHGDAPEAVDREALRAWWSRALPIQDRIQPPGDRRDPGTDRRYTPRQLAALHELGALSETQVWGRLGMAG